MQTARTHNKLKYEQILKLGNWLNSQRDSISDKPYNVIAATASEQLAMTISDQQVSRTCKALGITPRPQPKATLPDRVAQLEREVAGLRQGLEDACFALRLLQQPELKGH